jgi:integrase
MPAKRRANGEGTVSKRSDGRWEARVSYQDQYGNTKRQTLYGKTSTEARNKLKAAQARRDAGAPVKDASRTLGEWCTQWVNTSLAASPRKATTKALYASLLTSHVIAQPIASVTLDKLRPTDLEQWTVALRDRGLSAASIQKCFIVLRMCLDDAVRDNLLAKNPAAQLKQPALERTEARHLSTDELAALLSALQGKRCERVVRFIAGTGMRKGEALALRWSDVDFDKGIVRVSGTLTRLSGQLVVSEPKTAKSRRALPLTPALVALLKSQRTAQAADKLRAGSLWVDSGMVFTSETGAPLDPRNVLREVANAAVKAGLPSGVNVHSLRHTAATTLLESGIHLKAVSDFLGHADTRITGDIYGHTSASVMESAMAALSSKLSSNAM